MTSTPTDKQKTDQIVGECLVKAAHVVLGSRSDTTRQSFHHPEKNSWVMASSMLLLLPSSPHQLRLHLCVQFNLNIDEVDIAAQVFDHWRKDTSVPAYIEVQCLECLTD